MTLKGDLDSISLADVFQTLSMTQQEGTLYVQDGESRKAIYFGQAGVSLMRLRRFEEAVTAFQAVAKRRKEPGRLDEALFYLGCLLEERGDEAAARELTWQKGHRPTVRQVEGPRRRCTH